MVLVNFLAAIFQINGNSYFCRTSIYQTQIKMKFTSYLVPFLFVFLGFQALAQESAPEGGNPEETFSLRPFPKRATRGSFDYSTLEPFQAGLIGLFDLHTKYGKIFLGGDFQEVSKTKFSCDPIIQKMMQSENGPNAQADGKFFTPGKINQIQELEGYYYFKNNNFLPGIMANAEIWVKMEAYQTAKTSEKNCLLVKLLIPEKVNGQVKNSVYLLRSDGRIKAMPELKPEDFVKSKDFPNFWIIPLKDANGNAHISGQGFSVLGSFVNQINCKNLWGLIFPVASGVDQTKSIFLRKADLKPPVAF